MALVGSPVEVAIDSGSAKKARYTRLGPSIRNSRRSLARAWLAVPALARVPRVAPVFAGARVSVATSEHSTSTGAASTAGRRAKGGGVRASYLLRCRAATDRGAPPVSATPSAQYRLTIRVRLDDSHGILGQLTSAIGDAGGIVGAVDLVEVDGAHSLRDVVVDASGKEHWTRIIEAIASIE